MKKANLTRIIEKSYECITFKLNDKWIYTDQGKYISVKKANINVLI